MKNPNIRFLPASLAAGSLSAVLIFSCATQDEKAPVNNDYSAKADSVSTSAASASGTYQLMQTEQKNIQGEAASQLFAAKSDNMDIASEEKVNPLDFVFSSSAAQMNRLDSTHRFIRTADMKFRAQNVAQATYHIEDITRHFGGYVADTKLSSELQSRYEVPVSADSSLETMRYVVTNTILLRIPARNLDTTLKSFVPLIDYLDYRNINTHDITLDELSNLLAQKRNANYSARLAKDIDNKGTKLPDVQSAELSILQQQEATDNALIQNLQFEDQVRYSTVTIQVYQRETIRQELVKREKTIDAYEPGFDRKLGSALGNGWKGLRIFILMIVTIWPLWLIGAAALVVIRFYMKKKKAVK